MIKDRYNLESQEYKNIRTCSLYTFETQKKKIGLKKKKSLKRLRKKFTNCEYSFTALIVTKRKIKNENSMRRVVCLKM